MAERKDRVLGRLSMDNLRQRALNIPAAKGGTAWPEPTRQSIASMSKTELVKFIIRNED